jgi:outer membrane protein assembly factor BamD
MKKSLRLVCILCLLTTLTLGACSSTGKDEDLKGAPAQTDATVERQEPVEKMYNTAARTLDEGKYSEAANLFDEVDRQYPYSAWATKAQLMSGYAHYKNLKYDEAVLALDRFIELHPGDENAPYAWYLKALCFYEQISDVRRDQRMTELALENLQQVTDRFPDSKYAKDAKLKIDLTLDHLAGKEMEIGRYYLDRKQYQAAINRFQKVVESYETTTHVPEALHRLTESYLSLGIIDEAKKTAAVLGHNYPQSSWYKDTYRLFNPQAMEKAENESLYDKTVGRIF